MEQLKLVALIGDKNTNELMRKFGLREDGKLYCRSVEITATLDGSKTADEAFGGLVASLRETYDVAIVRSTSHSLRWRNQSVKTVSDGNRFVLLDAIDK